VLALVVLPACRTLAPPDPARLSRVLPRLGDLLLVGFHGTTGEPDGELDRLLCGSRVGGVLLFGRNVVEPGQIGRLARWAAERARACAGRALLIATDAEGGRVMRLGAGAGYTPTLSHQQLGDANDLALTELEARRIGGRLRDAGIAWDLAPVVDVGYNPANPVIVGAGRSFGADPGRVIAHARAYVAGMRAAGILTTLKHFPGHGSSFTDSHLGFVDVTGTARPALELAPYRALMTEGAVDSVMTAHVFNRRLDRSHPATLSRSTIAGLLRGELGWTGVVVSDDLRMGAIEQHYGLDEAAVLALNAGVDLLCKPAASPPIPSKPPSPASTSSAPASSGRKARSRPRRWALFSGPPSISRRHPDSAATAARRVGCTPGQPPHSQTTMRRPAAGARRGRPPGRR
jgi:beta-N-acetylhexosaminidase